VAKDTGGVAVSRLCTECSRRGCFWRSSADIAEGGGSFTSNEISVEKEDPSTEAVIYARHF